MYFAVARRMDRLEQICSDHIEPIKLDVTDEEAVSRTVNHVISTKGGPNCLNSKLSILSGISADSQAASSTVGSITA